MSPPTKTSGYTAVAKALHWLIALAIVGQILLAWYMGSLADHSPARDAIMPFHISIGLTILLLSLTRLAWRLTHKPPPLPAGLPLWERTLARISHVLFYILMLGIPVLGWLLVSTHTHGSAFGFWGAHVWPSLPGTANLSKAAAHQIGETVEPIHGGLLIWAMIAVWALHVAGALKHQFDGNPVLYRMVPFLKPPA